VIENGLYSFGPFLLDSTERVLERDGQAVSLPPKDMEILVVLVERAGRIVGKEELLEKVWPGVFVEEGNLSRYIFNLRQALGDGIDGQKYIETVSKRGYRFMAPVASPANPLITREGSAPHSAIQPPPRQDIRFCMTHDRVRLAWSSVGSGYPLVKAANWLNHLDFEWQSPIWKHWIAQLASHHRLIRYDTRGNGLSDWQVGEMSLELWVRDLEAVVDSANIEKCALLGISQGAAVAISYAVRHPERVSHLVIVGGYSRGYNLVFSPQQLEALRAVETMVRLNWGKDLAGFSEMFAKMFVGDDSALEARRWLDDLQRVSTTPENAARVMEVCDDIDVRSLLGRVSVPTIVFHCDGDRVAAPEEGRILASEIPGAKFVPLPGANHLLLENELSWSIFIQELGAFLGWADTGS